MANLEADRNPVEVLAAEFAERYRNGEHPAVSDYCDQYPEYADEIRELFPSVVMMERLKQKDKSSFESAQQRSSFAGCLLDRLGDYEIVREIGRGGMGVVFQALQASLGRVVALKVLSQSATASERQVQRFEREARAAARLHHTNIVPVFGVGHEDGLHFYVMQYIEGVGLDEVLEALKVVTAVQTDNGADEVTADDESEQPGSSAVVLANALRNGSFEGRRRSDSSIRDLSFHETRRDEASDATLDPSASAPGSADLTFDLASSDRSAAADRSGESSHSGLAGSSATLADASDTPVNDTPVNDTPVNDTPVNDTPGADTPGADTPGADAQGADAQGADAQGADAQGADAQGADAQSADAQSADAQSADAQSADAQSADAPLEEPSLAGEEPLPLLGKPYFKSVARIALQAADALQYAHAQGVLHRDMKPGNLLLDAAGTVWLTDFGLAKLAEHHDLTKTGDIVGTLRYMAPEQFEGKSEARSDLYSLGLTLYEFLTLRPACDDTAIKQLFQQHTRDSLVRPRTINPAIPRDLETIVLKSVAVEPEARYASAAAMADDLQRFLDDRSILARRATPVERLRRWCRRNPAIATLSFTAITLAILLFIVLGTGYVRVDAQRREVLAANERAEANLQLAVDAFDNIIDNIGSRGVPQSFELQLEDEETVPQYETVVTAADAELLQGLLGFFDRFAAQNSANLQSETARAYRRVGDIQLRLGHLDEAERKYEEALGLYEQLAEEETETVDAVLARAGVLSDLAAAHRQAGEFESSIRRLAETRNLLEQQPPEIAAEPQTRFALAQAHLAMVPRIVPRFGGRWSGREPQGRPGEGGPREDRQGNRRRGRDGGPPGDPPVGPPVGPSGGPPGPRMEPATREGPANRLAWRGPGGGRGGGLGWPGRGRSPETPWHESLSMAEQLLTDLLAAAPENPEYRLEMARCCLGQFLLSRFGSPPHQPGCDRAVGLLEQLVADFPREPTYRFELADTLSIVSSISVKEEETLADLEQARDMAEELVRQFPHVPDYEFLMANCLARLASAHVQQGQYDAADSYLRLTIEKQRQLVERFSSAMRYQILLARTHRDLARNLMRQGDIGAARDTLLEAIELLEEVQPEGNVDPFSRRERAGLFYELAETYSKLGEDDKVKEVRQRAQALTGGRGMGAPRGPWPGRPPERQGGGKGNGKGDK